MLLLSCFFVLLALTQHLNCQHLPPQSSTPQASSQGSCASVKPGEPIALNVQSVDEQNVGDQCFTPIQCNPDYEFRYMDGRCNNLNHPSWGMTDHPIVRLQAAAYSTNPNDPPGTPRRGSDNQPLHSTRVLSNVFFTDHSFPSKQYTLAFMVMSQVLTHDVISMKLRSPPQDGCCKNGGTERIPRENWDSSCLAIFIPTNDRFYSEFHQICSQVARAQFTTDSGCQLPGIEQSQMVTSYVDGSVVYGAWDEIGKKLRSGQDGKLKFETTPDGRVFLPRINHGNVLEGSDGRVSLHAQLSVIQTLLLRVHNKICDELKDINRNSLQWQDDELLYQTAKKILTGMLQHTFFEEFSQILFGPECAKAYGFSEADNQGYSEGYDAELNAGTTAEFEHAAFRAFHSMVAGEVLLYNNDRQQVGEYKFSDQLNNPWFITEANHFDEILIGMCTQPTENFDRFYSTAITREFQKAFNNGKYGSDLAAIDIERGRDCGLQPYIYYATLAGWPPVKNFDELSDRIDPKMIDRLKKMYKSVEDIDAMLGILLEFPFGSSMFGKTLHYVMAEQFRRYKYGDSLFYSFKGRGQFTPGQLAAIKSTSLSLLICWGSDGIQNIQKNAYIVPGNEPLLSCKQIIDDFRKQLAANWAVNSNQ